MDETFNICIVHLVNEKRFQIRHVLKIYKKKFN